MIIFTEFSSQQNKLFIQLYMESVINFIQQQNAIVQLLYNKGSCQLLSSLCVRHCHHQLTAVSSKISGTNRKKLCRNVLLSNQSEAYPVFKNKGPTIFCMALKGGVPEPKVWPKSLKINKKSSNKEKQYHLMFTYTLFIWIGNLRWPPKIELNLIWYLLGKRF